MRMEEIVLRAQVWKNENGKFI